MEEFHDIYVPYQDGRDWFTDDDDEEETEDLFDDDWDDDTDW